MKKNQKGFFLAETIIMIALITTVVAFVFPNVSKLYENFVNRTKYYDQTEDVFFLKAVGECLDVNYVQVTKKDDKNILMINNYNITEMGTDTMLKVSNDCTITPKYLGNGGEVAIYVAKYMATPGVPTGFAENEKYEFNKFLHRLKKTNNDTAAHRIIGRFKIGNSYRFASVKYIFREDLE